MATKDKQPDVKIYLRSDRPPEEPTEPLKEETQFPMVVGDVMDFVSDQDTAVRRYEMNEFSETGQPSLLEMNEDGDIESMVKPIIEGQEPVMMKKDERGMPLNPTMGMIMEHFADLSMKVQKDPSVTGQMKNIVSIPGQAIENAVGNTLKFFIKNTPDDFQNKFYDLGLDMERLGLVEKEGQPLGGLVGLTGSSKEFKERQFFSPEENSWWEDIGVGFAQFYTGLKGIQMIANTKKLLAPSMAADALVFDPTDGGLFSMINQLDLDPGAIQDFVEFMDSTQHDQNMGRAIQVAEGLMIGGLLGGTALVIQNKEPIKQFIKKVFTPESYGRKAADPAIRKVAELLTEVKSKWPKNHKFEKYMDKFGRSWRKNMGNERGAVGSPIEQAKDKVNEIIADLSEIQAEINASGPTNKMPVQEQEFFVKEQERLNREYDQAVKELEALGGTPTVTLSRPKPSKPLNTDTKKFKKWFKDSKVVDEQGNPLVVYHGTGADIESFDISKQSSDAKLGKGFYFSVQTNLPNLAAKISERRGGSPNVMPVYLSLKNPKVFEDSADLPLGTLDSDKLKGMGHDGVILKKNGSIWEITVFEPTQIKSKFNPGTFDPANPNIMAGALAVPAVYDPDQEPEFQQAGWGSGIRRGLGKLFKSDPPPGRTVAPDKPRPAYGKATELYIREKKLKDKPIDLPPDTAEFLSRQDDIDFKNVDLYGKHERVNFGTIENSGQFGEDFRKFLVRALELDDAAPESITFDEIIAKAEKLKWGSKDVMKLKPEDWDNSAGMLKVKDVWLQTAAYAHKMTKLMAEGDPSVTPEMFRTAINNFAIVNKQKEGLQASIARTLTAQRIKRPGVETENIEDFAKRLMGEAPELTGNLTDQQIAKTILIAGDDASAQAWGELAEEIPGLQEIFFSHFYPFMLSSFRTHAANFLSNGFVTADYLGTQGFAAMASPVRRRVLSQMPLLSRIFKDTEDRKTAKEFLHTLEVLKQLLPESFAVARKAYNAPTQLDMGKMERKKMPSEIVNAESMQQILQNLHNNPKLKDKYIQRFIFPKDLKQGGAIARGIDWWGKKLDYPGKLLHSADEFAKTYSKGLGELDFAYRRAGKLLEEGVITREQHMETVQEVLKARSPKMIEAGETLAEFQTFQNALGDVGKWLQEGREKLSNFGWGIPWAHMILAFVKTPINVQKYNFHLMNLTQKSRADIMGKNGGAKQDEALGRWGVASMYVTSATGLATNFFSDDVTLHGNGKYGAAIDVEGKENQRAQRMVEMNAGIKPCSIGIRDNKGTIHSYSFNTIEPLATYFCATADVAQNWHELVADVGEGEAMKVMATLYEVMANNLINKNFAKNFHEFMTTVMDPNSVSGSPKYVDNIVTMVIPRIVKDLNTSLSETQHREFQHSMDGFMGMWEVMASNIPGLSKQLGPKVNYWNEPIYNYGSWGPDFLSPFRYSKATPDAVDNEMYRLLMPMRDLPRKLDGIKMHPRVRLHWYYLMNNYESRGSGLKMKQAVAQLISPKNSRYHGDMNDKYPGDPTGADLERIELIKGTLNMYKTEAKNQLLAGYHDNDIAKMDPIVMKYQPDLFDRIRAKKAQKKDTRGPLTADDMNMRSEWEWRDYYKNAQQQPPLGFK